MIQKMVVLSSFSVFFNYECSIILESIIELTVYTLDGFFLVCVLTNMDLCVCDFAICDIGMKNIF